MKMLINAKCRPLASKPSQPQCGTFKLDLPVFANLDRLICFPFFLRWPHSRVRRLQSLNLLRRALDGLVELRHWWEWLILSFMRFHLYLLALQLTIMNEALGLIGLLKGLWLLLRSNRSLRTLPARNRYLI